MSSRSPPSEGRPWGLALPRRPQRPSCPAQSNAWAGGNARRTLSFLQASAQRQAADTAAAGLRRCFTAACASERATGTSVNAQWQETHQIEVHGHVVTHVSHLRLRCHSAIERHLIFLSVHLDNAPQHILATTYQLQGQRQEALSAFLVRLSSSRFSKGLTIATFVRRALTAWRCLSQHTCMSVAR